MKVFPPMLKYFFAHYRYFCRGLLCLFILSSSDCTSPVGPSRKDIGALRKAASTPKESPATTNDLVVYLDVSAPMKGYLADGQSVFSHALKTLREFSATLSPPVDVHLRKVDKHVGPILPHEEIRMAALDKGIYTGSESNLVEAIRYFPQNLHTPSDSSQPPPRFHLLVTDGVYFSRQEKTTKGTQDGLDALQVRMKIMELLDKGWSGAVLGMRSQFCCEFFSELKPGYVAFKTAGRPVEEYRPFYFFIFSPDHAALDGFINSLKETLRKEVGEKNLLLRELPLTANYAEGPVGFDTAAVTLPQDKARLSIRRAPDEARDNPLMLTLRLKEEKRTEEVPFALNLTVNWSSHGKDCGGTQELAGVLDWKLEPTFHEKEESGKLFPEVLLGKVEPNDRGGFRFAAGARWPRTVGKADWRGYRLIARIRKNSDLNWIREWSTDDDRTAAAGSRTLELKTTLLGLWHNPVLENQPIAEAYLRVGPQ